MISFKANFIHPMTIDRINGDGSYSKQITSFIELNPLSDADIGCLHEVSKKWNHGATFADDILTEIIVQNRLLKKHDYRAELDERRFFALTRQQCNFDKLNPSKVIALAVMSKEYDNPYDYLDLLQVKPSLKKGNGSAPRKVKNIGKYFTQEILKTYENKTIVVEPLWSVIGFYEKLGFKKCKDYLSGFFTQKTMAYIKPIKP